jgi:UDP-N-acetylglucosamine--N-acetylmuramyl-(pentapeptide) pyrophosphoryl-undecaprenol N-acetylglucosamine transferase
VRSAAAKPTPLRILNYAVNGLGLGHLTRLIAINRQVRRLAGVLGIPTEIVFLTSNEGDALAYQHGFASFKIPSKSSLVACGLDPVRHRKIAKQWVWNAINLISPDILIVDTFPAGGFQELFDVLDLGSKNVFIYRAVRKEAALVPAFQSALRGYHLIIKPQEQGENDSPVPSDLEDRVATTGEILIRSASEILNREAAREILGIPDNAEAVIYVSVGGGGDSEAETMFATVIDTARRMPETYFVIGAGSLYRGREFHAPNVSWTRRSVMMECFKAFDAALTAGGYNTVNELMHCGIPCVFLPQGRTHDDQERRVTRCVDAGAGLLLEERTPEAIQTALLRLRNSEVRRKASESAAASVPRNDALTAAEEILALIADEVDVEDASLLADPSLFVPLTGTGIDEATYLVFAHQIRKLLGGVQDDERAEAIATATRTYLGESLLLGVSQGRLLGVLRRAAKLDAEAETPLTPETLTEHALSLLKEDLEN